MDYYGGTWAAHVHAALLTAWQQGAALPVGPKHGAIEGTDMNVILAGNPFFDEAADLPAFLNSVRGALRQQCGGALHFTTDLPKSKVPHMRASFLTTPAAVEVKRQLASTGWLDFQVGEAQVHLPLRLVPGTSLPNGCVLIAHYPVGAEMLHTDFWRVVLTAAGYEEAAASCTASFLPSHAGGDPAELDGSKIIAYAIPPADDPTFSRMPRQFVYDGGRSHVRLSVADHDNAVNDRRAAPAAEGTARQHGAARADASRHSPAACGHCPPGQPDCHSQGMLACPSEHPLGASQPARVQPGRSTAFPSRESVFAAGPSAAQRQAQSSGPPPGIRRAPQVVAPSSRLGAARAEPMDATGPSSPVREPLPQATTSGPGALQASTSHVGHARTAAAAPSAFFGPGATLTAFTRPAPMDVCEVPPPAAALQPSSVPLAVSPPPAPAPAPPPLHTLPVSVSDVDGSPLTDALFRWAQDHAPDASLADQRAAVRELRVQRQELWETFQHEQQVPAQVRDAFMAALFVVNAEAGAAAQAAARGYDTSPAPSRSRSPVSSGRSSGADVARAPDRGRPKGGRKGSRRKARSSTRAAAGSRKGKQKSSRTSVPAVRRGPEPPLPAAAASVPAAAHAHPRKAHDRNGIPFYVGTSGSLADSGGGAAQ
jgi:hypothetical protein